MARSTVAAPSKKNDGVTSTRKKTTKADLIETAIQAGVPANRLKGTIPQIQEEVRTYLEAQAEAASDVADAAFISPAAPVATKGGIHPMNGVYIGGAVAALWHFLS